MENFGRGGSQIPAPAVWNSLIERSDQSSLNYLEFAFPAENSELSDFDFFNGIGSSETLLNLGRNGIGIMLELLGPVLREFCHDRLPLAPDHLVRVRSGSINQASVCQLLNWSREQSEKTYMFVCEFQVSNQRNLGERAKIALPDFPHN